MTQEPAEIRKAWKLIEALAEPCADDGDADHAWRTCRRCLAVSELECRTGRYLIAALAKWHQDALAAADSGGM
jgi:hypothetical protein